MIHLGDSFIHQLSIKYKIDAPVYISEMLLIIFGS